MYRCSMALLFALPSWNNEIHVVDINVIPDSDYGQGNNAKQSNIALQNNFFYPYYTEGLSQQRASRQVF